jgi:hypothetical protein
MARIEGLFLSETRWVRMVAFAPAAAVASFGAVGLVLADAGVYKPLLALPLGFVVWVVMLRMLQPVMRAPARSDRAGHLAAAAAVVLSASVGVWNALHASQHVLTDRDPAIYNNAARWIASHGNLEFSARLGPFAAPPFDVSAPGLSPLKGQKVLSFQFAHFLPALLAEARSLGGDRLMFMLPPILGAVALLAFFVVASRVLHNPAVALGATACIAFLMPQVYFSRDSYSEIPMQVLLFTALWMLCDESIFRRPGPAFIAGFFIGVLQAVRLDALSIVVGIPVVCAAAWIHGGRRDRRPMLISVLAAAGGIAIGLAIGYADLHYRSYPYLRALRGNVRGLLELTLLAVAASLAVASFAPAIGRILQGVVSASRRRVIANAAAVLAILVGFGAWLVRPALSPLPAVVPNPTSALQAAGTIVKPGPFVARTVVWLGWYLGPVTLVLAIIAAALLARALVLHVRWEWLVASALLAPEMFLYLWRPKAHPDQLWVTRRLLVCVFPAVILLAFGLIRALATRAHCLAAANRRSLGQAAAIALGLVAVLYPMWTDVHVRNMSEQRDFLPVVKAACRVLGPDAALVVVPERTSAAHLTVPAPVHTWCGIPTAQYRGLVDRAALEQAATKWKEQGRTLWIGAEDPNSIRAWFPGTHPTETRQVVNTYQLSRPLSHRPTGYLVERFQLALAPVPTG